MSLEQSWWFIPQRDFSFEGGGKPENLGKSTFYLAGCLAPRARTVVEGGEYKIAYLADPGVKEDIPPIKEGLKVRNITKEWFLTVPFCCSFSYPKP